MKLFNLSLFLFVATVVNASVVFTVFQSGFGDENGIPTNGMNFGFVVDVNNDGFDVGNYTSFDLTVNTQPLSTLTGSSDDVYVYDFNHFETIPSFLGDGSIGNPTLPYIDDTVTNSFALIWFPDSVALAASPYGFATDVNFIVPPDGGASFFPSMQLGDAANFTVAIPEPRLSSISLILIIFTSVIYRRK